ncbi:MAG: site-specific DNA-methyltransferase, partial [Methanolinea sp.]|nr:site-specific DNA-methyltransferase [Methanolinea sp.]
MDPNPYYHDGQFTLFHGDCLEVLEQMPEEEVDLIFADPPYNLSNGGFTCHSGRRASVDKGSWDASNGIDQDFQFHTDWIRACRRVLKERGSIWISGTYHSIYACGFALQREGFWILNDICWYKPNAPPNLSCRYFTASHETLLWARRSRNGKHVFNYQEMKGGVWREDGLKRPGRQMRSVWSVPTPRASEKGQGSHPTQKPVALLKRIILACTREGDLVLDPFTGSSTAGLAACALGRRFVGIDTEREFLDMSIRRYHEMKNS